MGRSVTASQRCRRPLSSRQDVCGPGPPAARPRDLWLRKGLRGAEARPEVGGFDVSLAAPVGFPRFPEQCRGKQAQPHGAAVTRVTQRGAWGLGPSLSHLGASLTSATSSLQDFQPPYLYPRQPPSARGTGCPGEAPAVLVALASATWAVGRLAWQPPPPGSLSALTNLSSSIIWYLPPR